MTKHFGISGVNSSLQFGKTGSIIKQVAGEFSARNAADSAFATFNVATPTAADNAATKSYVDLATAALNVHAAVKVATTAPLTDAGYTAGTTGADGGTGVGAKLENTGTQLALVIDTHTVVYGERVLVKDQADAKQNGIYVVDVVGTGSTNWRLIRAADGDNHATVDDVEPGDFTFVTSGFANISTGWVESGTSAVVIGTNNITWTQFSSAGIITVSAGSALDKTGNDLSVRYDGTTIGVNATGNGQLIVRSDTQAGATLISDGVDGNAATWSFVDDLRGAASGRYIIDGLDSGGSNTNYLKVQTSDGTATPTVTLSTTNAGGGGDAADVDMILEAKGSGNIVVGNAISTISDANLFLSPNGTGLVQVSAAITTGSNANLILEPNGTGMIAAGATITSVSNANLVLDPNGTGLVEVGAALTTASNANLILSPNGTGMIAVSNDITTISNANLKLSPNGTGIIVVSSDIDVGANTIKTTVSNGDIKILPDGTGVISVAGTVNYETNVTADDDIPNRKFVVDADSAILSSANSTAQGYANTAESNANGYTDTAISTEVTNRNNAIAAAAPVTAKYQAVTADGTNDTFAISSPLPTVSGKATYVSKVILNVATLFAGGSVTQAKVVDATDQVLMTFAENDITVAGVYVADVPFLYDDTGSQVSIKFYENDGTTAAIPTSGAAFVSVMFDLV